MDKQANRNSPIIPVQDDISGYVKNLNISIISGKYPECQSVKVFRHWINSQVATPKRYYICPGSVVKNCNAFFEENTATLPEKCMKCESKLEIKNLLREGQFFLYTSVAEQLSAMLRLVENENAVLDFQETITRAQNAKLCDTINSERYKSLLRMAKAKDQSDKKIPMMSFSVNLDGVQASKSSQNSLYPLMLVTNEIPHHMRQRNILIPFIFLKRRGVLTKFHSNYLSPFILEMRELGKANGFSFVSQRYECTLSFPVLCYSLNCDSIMKCDLLHLKGVTGYFSCPKCKQKGFSVEKGKSSTVVKPATTTPNGMVPVYQSRSHADFANVKEVEDGVHDISILASLPGFENVFANTSIDSMHAVYIGVFKLAVKLWFTEKGKPFSVSPAGYRLAKQTLLKIKPSRSNTRGIRCLDERADWKACEWRSFGYLWAPLILQTLADQHYIDKLYLDNWICLLCGLSLLNSDCISKSDIDTAKKCLLKFCVDFTKLYGEKYCVLNIHLIVHLADSVTLLGPLWSTSLFINESFNQTVLKCFRNGTRGVVQQVSERFNWRKLSVDLNSWMKTTDMSYSCPIADSCWKLCSTDKTEGLGKYTTRKEGSLSSSFCELQKESVYFYDRIHTSGMVFTTKEYFRKKKLRNRDTLFYSAKRGIFGEIVEIIKAGEKYFVVYQEFKTYQVTSSRINDLCYTHFGRFTSTYSILSVKFITRQCILLNFSFGDCMMYEMNIKEGS